MRSRYRIVRWSVAVCFISVAAYLTVFGFWWWACPREEHDISGVSVRVVACRSWTIPLGAEGLWRPAFWLVYVAVYRPVGFAPQLEGDVAYWAPPRTEP